jgi:hypothetical protein
MRIHLTQFLRLLYRPWTAALLFVLGLIVLKRFEGPINHMAFVAIVILTMAALTFLLSRRPYFSLYTGLSLMFAVTIVSTIKYRLKGFDLHVFDFTFTGGDPQAMLFLLKGYSAWIVPVLVLLVATVVFLWMVAKFDQPIRISATWRAAMLLPAVPALMMSYPLPSDEPRYFHYLGGFDASSFFISMIDLQYLFRQSEFEDRMRRTSPQPPYPDTLACGDPAKLPDVYLVLSESQMDFSILPGLHTVNPANANFMPEGRHLRPLQVETYAGGTWVSSISLMAGLPSADFGVQAPYLTMVLDGKVRGALPEVFARCGYRTVEVTPVKRTFVNEGPFMENIGYQTIFDYDAIGATEYAHEDNFYFNAAEKIVREHHATDKRPLLLYMKTMFTHSPYLHTDVNKHTVAFDGSAELNEYLNRSIAAQNDFLDFLKVVEKQTTVRGSVVLEFGDHHPGVMKELDDAAHGGNSLADLRSLAYRTYYTIHAFDYQLDMTAFPTGPIDIGFLGAALIQAGRLPTSPMYRDLIALNAHCGGRFHDCADRAAVDRFLRKRVDSGMLNVLPQSELSQPLKEPAKPPIGPGGTGEPVATILP